MKKNIIKSLIISSVVLASSFSLSACGGPSAEDLMAQKEQTAKAATTLDEEHLKQLTGEIIAKVLNTDAVFNRAQQGSKHKVSISKITIKTNDLNMNKKDIRRIVQAKLEDSNEFEVYDILDRENTHNVEVTLQNTLQNKDDVRISSYNLKLRFLGLSDNSHHTFQARKTYEYNKNQ